MTVRIRQVFGWLADTFWLVPGIMVLLGLLSGVALVAVDRDKLLPPGLISQPWVYDGGAAGARALLGAVASSTIGVAGTAFSITIAALSLAAGQMGPRLLRNFTRDRGNQITLGTFLGTFTYALMVVRSVRDADEGGFVPYLALTVAVALALVCVGMLVFFIGRMAGRINVDTVLGLVSQDVGKAIARLTVEVPGPPRPPAGFWAGAHPVRDDRRGYLQHVDAEALAGWAAGQGVVMRLLVRPGDFLFPGTPIAEVTRPVAGAPEAVARATALAAQRDSVDDLEFAIRQVVEVAVRALSSGINDPYTAIGALDWLGAALCDLARVHLPTGVVLRDDRVALVMPAIDYDGLLDAMFHPIRQNAAGSAGVLIRLLEVLAAVASCERDPSRIAGLRRHADLAREQAEQGDMLAADLADLRARHAAFSRALPGPRAPQETDR